VDYLASYNVSPPQRGPWKPSPVPETGPLSALYWLCDRFLRAGAVLRVAHAQRELLTTGVLAIAWQAARERAVAAGGAVMLEAGDTLAAVQAVFAIDDAGRLVADLWPVPEAWLLAWREAGTRDPELLAVMGLGEPELRLLDADE
jgi:hypothetical protein